MHTILKKASYAFATIALLSACSRPYATLQRTPVDLGQTAITASSSFQEATPSSEANQLTQSQPSFAAPSPTISEALAQSEALVSTNNRLTNAQKHTLVKRMNRIKRVLAVTPLMAGSINQTTTSTHKTTAMERMVVKKINKQIQQKLSPQQPQLNSGVLATGAVLVLIGLLLVLLTSGTAATLGIVALLAGAVLLLVGLL